MTGEEVIVALQATPLHPYDDLASRSPKAPAKVAGYYAWWQTPGALPGVPGTPHPSEPVELLYIGIAPRDAYSKSDLRQRLSNHYRSPIGSSTFRLDLAAFLWERQGWRLSWTDRPKLHDDDLAALAAWQRKHLSVQWIEVADPWLLEASVVRVMRPPLNRDHNGHHPFYNDVGCARDRLRGAARSA